MTTKTESNERVLTVQQIMSEYGFEHCYIERAITKKWIDGAYKVAMPNSKVMQWVVPQSKLIEWRKRVESHKGKSFKIRANFNDAETLQEQLKQMKADDRNKLLASLQALAKGAEAGKGELMYLVFGVPLCVILYTLLLMVPNFNSLVNAIH